MLLLGRSLLLINPFSREDSSCLPCLELGQEPRLLNVGIKAAFTCAPRLCSWCSYMVPPALQYRTRKNYTNPAYLVPRMGGQLMFSFIYFSLYWKAGEG